MIPSHGIPATNATIATNGSANGNRYRIDTSTGTLISAAITRATTTSCSGVRSTLIGDSSMSVSDTVSLPLTMKLRASSE